MVVSPAEHFRLQLGARIRAARLEKRWSQEELAERAGLSYKFLGEVERGSGNPSMDTLFDIASALGVPPADLVGRGETDPEAFVSRVSRDRLFSAREALESLDDLLKDLTVPLRRRRAARSRKRHPAKR